MDIERLEFCGVTFAEVIRAGVKVEASTFVSRPESSLQLGLLAHKAGFVEAAHRHKQITRQVDDLQQFLVVQTGRIEITFHSDDGTQLGQVELGPGDSILLVHGAHSLRAVANSQCISVKQGPFLGAENDKVELIK